VQVRYTDSREPATAHDLVDADAPLGTWRNEKGAEHVSRAYAAFDLSSYAGRNVTAGLLTVEERSATDCTKRAVEVLETDDAVFTFSGNGDPDVAGFYYTLGEVSVPGCSNGQHALLACPEPFSGPNRVRADVPGGSVTLPLPPPGGRGTLKVLAIEEAGREFGIVRHEFDPRADSGAPGPGDPAHHRFTSV
jgi:hypothetical protein